MNVIRFIRDDEHERKIKQLQEILDVLAVKPRDADIQAAKIFFFNLVRAAHVRAEKKKEESEQAKAVKKIDQKAPPKPKRVTEEYSTATHVHDMHELTMPPIPPHHTEGPSHLPPLPPSAKQWVELPEIIHVPKPGSVKKEEEGETIKPEEILSHVVPLYPLIIFKNLKGEVIVQSNLNQQGSTVTYELSEPEIDMRLVEETKNLVLKDFQKNRKIIKDEKYLADNVKKAFKRLKIDYTDEYKDEIKYFLYKDLLGLGRVDPLLHDPNVKTITCDGLNKPVKVSLGPGIEVDTNIIYTNKEVLEQQVKHLAMKTRNQISENNPAIEGTFYHFKVQATLGFGEVDSKFVIKKMP